MGIRRTALKMRRNSFYAKQSRRLLRPTKIAKWSEWIGFFAPIPLHCVDKFFGRIQNPGVYSDLPKIAAGENMSISH